MLKNMVEKGGPKMNKKEIIRTIKSFKKILKKAFLKQSVESATGTFMRNDTPSTK